MTPFTFDDARKIVDPTYYPRLSSVPLHELEETIKELGSEDLEAALFQHKLETRP